MTGRALLTLTGPHCPQGQTTLQHMRGAESLRLPGILSMCPHAMPLSQPGLSCMLLPLVARWKTLCGHIWTEPPSVLQPTPGMPCSMIGPHTVHTQLQQSMTTGMGNQSIVSL